MRDVELPIGRYLVAGGAGFLGSHLCDRIMRAGSEAIALDSLSTGHAANLDYWMRNPAFTLLRHDLNRPLPLFGRLDGIFHLGIPSSPTEKAALPVESLRGAAHGTEQILAVARENGCRIVIGSSEGPNEPESYVEALVTAHRREYRTSALLIRLPEAYGPRMRLDDGRAVATFVKRSLNERAPSATPSPLGAGYFYVTDVVEALVRAFIEGSSERFILSIAELMKDARRTDAEVAIRQTLASFQSAARRWKRAS